MRRTRLLAAIVALTGVACSGSGRAQGPTVFAASSLRAAFSDIAAASAGTARHPVFNFAGSQQLISQIIAGAPADVIATADEPTMQRLVHSHLVKTPRVFARNRLAIAVAKGNPKGVRALTDLARPDLRIALADPSVPVGRYAQQALEHAGVVVHPVTLELDVSSTLAKVTSGDVDAAIVYGTDIAAASRATDVAGVSIADSDNVVAAYPIAVLVAAPHPQAARVFVADVLGPRGQAILRARGFLAP